MWIHEYTNNASPASAQGYMFVTGNRAGSNQVLEASFDTSHLKQNMLCNGVNWYSNIVFVFKSIKNTR